MTLALCINCGATKFGAFGRCPECAVATSGIPTLDILFSSHHMSVATLKAFGEVVRAIRRVCDDDKLSFASFLYFVSINHPELLGASLFADQQQRCVEILARAKPLPVRIKESERARWRRELKLRGDSA